MSLSFSLKPSSSTEPSKQRRKVLVTGAAGNIGRYLAEHCSDRYELRLMVRSETDSALAAFGELVTGELADFSRLLEHCRGIDTVVHLAADPSPYATWDSLLPNNIVGTYNLYAAAKSAGCRRVIYASSIHAVSGYPADVQVKTGDPVNPGDLYGVSKCFGEALGRYMAEQEKLSVIAIRIGAFQPIESARAKESLQLFDAFISHRDLAQLIARCIDDERLQFAIFNGLSDNRFKRLDITDAKELVGYAPEDDFSDEHPQLKALHLSEAVLAHNVSDRSH